MIKWYMVVLRKMLSMRKKSVGMLFQMSGFVLFICFYCFKIEHLFFSVGWFKMYALTLIINKGDSLIFRENYNFNHSILAEISGISYGCTFL